MSARMLIMLIMLPLLLSSCASRSSYAERYYKKCTPIKLYEKDQVSFRSSVRRDHTYSLGVSFFYNIGDAFSDYNNKFPLLAKLDPEIVNKCKIPGFGCPTVGLIQVPDELRFGVRIIRIDKPEVFFDGEMVARFINNGSAGVLDMPFYKPEVPKRVYDRFIMRKGVYDIHVSNVNPSASFLNERTCIHFFEETHK